jgi:hypothetical protein
MKGMYNREEEGGGRREEGGGRRREEGGGRRGKPCLFRSSECHNN